MIYDFVNKPFISDSEDNSPYLIKECDLYDDIGDCVHAKSPFTGEEWRFYYQKKKGKKILDAEGIIQL